MTIRLAKLYEISYYPVVRDFVHDPKNKWMLEALDYNPDYTDWGNDQDYMCYTAGWNGCLDFHEVSELIELDELNELVNFYFFYSCPSIYEDEDVVRYQEKEPITFNLQMWILHPRKGASRGVILHDIQKKDMPRIINYLKEARERNHERFARLP